MVRFLILIGYSQLMLFLQATGKLDQFINTHYQYLATLSMILSLILGCIQLYLWVKEGKQKESDEGLSGEIHSHEGHSHEMTRKQTFVAAVLLCLPLMVGFFFPTVSLDSTIVQAKGFEFPISKESVGDPEMNTQYLQPNTSIYYTKDVYKKLMDQLRKKYEDNGTLVVTDENYLEVMELIYNYPSEFTGRAIRFEGFSFNAPKNQGNFLFRFGIIHCVADSGVFGLRLILPENTSYENNQWLAVEGKIELDYYEPFTRDIPAVRVSSVRHIEAPSNQYVYRKF